MAEGKEKAHRLRAFGLIALSAQPSLVESTGNDRSPPDSAVPARQGGTAGFDPKRTAPNVHWRDRTGRETSTPDLRTV
jgi:hypothetical protein